MKKSIGSVIAVTLIAATSFAYEHAWVQDDYSLLLGGTMQATRGGDGKVSGLAVDFNNDPGNAFEGEQNPTLYFSEVGDMLGLCSSGADLTLSGLGMVVFSNGVTMAGADAENPAVFDLESTEVVMPSEVRISRCFDTANQFLVSRNTQLSTITNVTARLVGTAGGLPAEGILCFVTTNAAVRIYEFQKRTSVETIRGVRIKLVQSGFDIYASAYGYAHLTSLSKKPEFADITEGDYSLWNLPLDPNNSDWSHNTSSSASMEATNVILYCSSPVTQPEIRFSVSNDLDNVKLQIGMTSPMRLEINGDNTSGKRYVLPRNGSVEVGPQGRLVFNCTMGNSVLAGNDYGVPIIVRKGGALVSLLDVYQFSGETSEIFLDGGSFVYGKNPNDGGAYVHNITYKDGAISSGTQLRLRTSSTKFTVIGSEPSTCENSLVVWGKAGNEKGFNPREFDVADVTGNDEVDFFVRGRIYNTETTGWANGYVVKNGAGTMSIDGGYDMWSHPTEINEGALLFTASNLISARSAFVLNGGKLAVAAGTSNSASTLKLTYDSAVVLGEGASLAFADSSAEAWEEGMVLDIVGNLSTSSIRFGTSAAGLTATQLQYVKNGKNKVTIDANGYLVAVPPAPAMLIFR